MVRERETEYALAPKPSTMQKTVIERSAAAIEATTSLVRGRGRGRS